GKRLENDRGMSEAMNRYIQAEGLSRHAGDQGLLPLAHAVYSQGNNLANRGDHANSEERFLASLKVLERLPPTRKSNRAAAQARLALGVNALAQGRLKEADSAIRVAVTLAEASADSDVIVDC